MDEIEELKIKLATVTKERNLYHDQLVDIRLNDLEKITVDHEARIRILQDGQVKSNTIYALFAGNGLLSIIAIFKLFT